MRVYYDCEFIENGKTIELISIGMVRGDGAEYYAVNRQMPTPPIGRHLWLMHNVVPHLPLTGPLREGYPIPLDIRHPDVRPRRVIRDQVQAFITETPDAELWADYGAYDHVVLCQLWGTK